MKKFLKRILLFAAIVITLFGIGEIVVRNMPDTYGYKDRYVSTQGEGIATLILGSSHTYYGVKCDLLGDSVFNLANVSQTPEIDMELLKHYMADMPNLRRVIIPISYFTFVDPKLEDTDEWFRCIGYKVSMHLPVHSSWSKYNFEISDFDGYRAKLQGLVVKKESNECDSLGWGLGFTLARRDARWEAKGKDRAVSTTLPLNQRADEVEEIIGETVKFCRANGIDVVFVTTPTWRTYRENLDGTQLADMKKRVERLTGRYGVPYFDMFADPDFVSDDFHDVDHLSDRGAAHFTGKLRRLLTTAR